MLFRSSRNPHLDVAPVLYRTATVRGIGWEDDQNELRVRLLARTSKTRIHGSFADFDQGLCTISVYPIMRWPLLTGSGLFGLPIKKGGNLFATAKMHDEQNSVYTIGETRTDACRYEYSEYDTNAIGYGTNLCVPNSPQVW